MGQRIRREMMVTAVKYTEGTTEKTILLGERTPDSSIEYNHDIEVVTDVLGQTHGDINKTEPVQTFDPHSIIKDNDFDLYMYKAAMEDDLNKLNSAFDVYIISAFIDEGTGSSHAYYTVKHTECTVLPTSTGGEAYLGMPIEIHYSNKITKGTVNEISEEFTFTPAKEDAGL